jgi:hypothetical protein
MATIAVFEGLVLEGREAEAENWLDDHKNELTNEQVSLLRQSAGLFLFQLKFKAEAKTHKDAVSQSARDKFNALFRQEVK